MNKETFLNNFKQEQEKKQIPKFNIWSKVSTSIKTKSLMIGNIILGTLLLIVLLLATTVEALYNMGYGDKNLQHVEHLAKLVNNDSVTEQIEIVYTIANHRNILLIFAFIIAVIIIASTVTLNYVKSQSKRRG